MNPNAKKRRPKGTRITLGGRNMAEESSSRFNNRKTSSTGDRTSSINQKRKERAEKINEKREARAMRKGDTITKITKKMVSPGSTKTSTVVDAPERTISTKKRAIVPDDVRAGDYAGKKELPAGQKPAPKKDGTFGEQLQYALAEGRKAGKTSIIFRGNEYAAGKEQKSLEKRVIPAKLKTVTKTTPPVYKEESKTQALYNKKIPKLKTKKKKNAKARPVNARVVKTKY